MNIANIFHYAQMKNYHNTFLQSTQSKKETEIKSRKKN